VDGYGYRICTHIWDDIQAWKKYDDAGNKLWEAPKFNDVISYHLGLEYAYTENINVWYGYANIPTPVPNQPKDSNYLGSDRHILSMGGEMKYDELPLINLFNCPVWLGWAVQYQMLKKRNMHKTDVLDDDDVQIGGYDYRLEGHDFTFFLSARIVYN